MAYIQPVEETVAGIEGLALSPDQQATLIDFIEQTIGADGEVVTEQVPAEGAGMPVEIDDGIEQVVITGGGTYRLPGTNMLVVVQTDDPVTIEGEPGEDALIAVVGGGGGDAITLGGAAAAPAAVGDPASAIVFAEGGDDTIVGTSGDDLIDGGTGDDSVSAGAGDDVIAAGEGADAIDGGAGFDTLVYNAVSRDDATVSVEGGTVTIVHPQGASGTATDTATGVEYVEFADGDPAIFLASADEATIARLYEVVVDRPADAAGLAFWLGVSEQGLATPTIADVMFGTPEFLDSVEEPLTAGEYVTLFYERGLDRPPEEAGLAFWTDVVETTGSPGLVAQWFAASDEAAEVHDYVTVIDDGLV